MEFCIMQAIDLSRENPVLRYAQPLEYGDAGAHKWIVSITDNDAKADLSEMSAKCHVTRSAGDAERAKGVTSVTVILDAEIDAQSGTVSCVFDKSCYGGSGAAVAIMRLSNASGKTITVAKLAAVLIRSTSDSIFDPDGIVPSLDALLEQIETIEAATKAAEKAATNAENATVAANEAARNADEKAASADDAARDASGWANATMTAILLPSGSMPTADVATDADGHKAITLGIPKGDTGVTPLFTIQVSTGAAGSDALAALSGTAENPVLHLTIPRGDTGAIENLTINGKPVPSGTIVLTPDDIGALPAEGTAVNAAALGGKAPAYYIRPINLLDNGSFARPVNQRGMSGTISTAGYFLDRWKLVSGSVTIGEDGITLDGTISQILERAPSGAVTAASSAGSASFDADTSTYSLTAAGELIAWAALYEGAYTADSLPPYVPKPYAAELLECQRYYYSIGSVGNYQLPIAHGICTSSTAARFILTLPIAMRYIPALTFPEGDLSIADGTDFLAFSALSVQNVRGNALYLSAAGSGFAAKHPCELRFVGVTGEIHYVEFSAEL